MSGDEMRDKVKQEKPGWETEEERDWEDEGDRRPDKRLLSGGESGYQPKAGKTGAPNPLWSLHVDMVNISDKWVPPGRLSKEPVSVFWKEATLRVGTRTLE